MDNYRNTYLIRVFIKPGLEVFIIVTTAEIPIIEKIWSDYTDRELETEYTKFITSIF